MLLEATGVVEMEESYSAGGAPATYFFNPFLWNNEWDAGFVMCCPDYANYMPNAFTPYPWEQSRVARSGHAGGVNATIDVDGRKVSIYSTHLCFNAATDDHAKRLVDALEASDANDLIIVCGDFNCKTEHTSGVKHFFDKGYKNIGLELGIETEDRFTYSAINPKDRDLGVIDQIVFRGDARATDGGMIELYPALSDHKPIWLEIKF